MNNRFFLPRSRTIQSWNEVNHIGTSLQLELYNITVAVCAYSFCVDFVSKLAHFTQVPRLCHITKSCITPGNDAHVS